MHFIFTRDRQHGHIQYSYSYSKHMFICLGYQSVLAVQLSVQELWFQTLQSYICPPPGERWAPLWPPGPRGGCLSLVPQPHQRLCWGSPLESCCCTPSVSWDDLLTGAGGALTQQHQALWLKNTMFLGRHLRQVKQLRWRFLSVFLRGGACRSRLSLMSASSCSGSIVRLNFPLLEKM